MSCKPLSADKLVPLNVELLDAEVLDPADGQRHDAPREYAPVPIEYVLG
ncbi:Uncharacterised protein [Yersinia enterocolitica]|nr:Uncharacterised protein [Yersinia enterocolitica]